MRLFVRSLLLAALLLISVSAQERVPSAPPRYRMELVYIFETARPDSTVESILVIGNSGFRTVAALERFVATLPKGAALEWSPGCLRLGGELLASAGELEEFRAFCRKRGIEFILHPSG